MDLIGRQITAQLSAAGRRAAVLVDDGPGGVYANKGQRMRVRSRSETSLTSTEEEKGTGPSMGCVMVIVANNIITKVYGQS
jgi:hypothetical protein